MKRSTLIPALTVALVVALAAPFAWSYVFGVTWVYPDAPLDLATRSEPEQDAWYSGNRQRASAWVHLKTSLWFVVDQPAGAALIAGFAFVPAFLIGLVAFRRPRNEL